MNNNDNNKKILIFLPYAGGSSLGIRKYLIGLESIVDVLCVDYPGHGLRFRTKLCNTFDGLLHDVERQILKYKGRNIIIMGHSLGGLIAAYIAKHISDELGDGLVGVIISSAIPPHLYQKLHIRDKMKESELIQYLNVERGVPLYVINSDEFQQSIAPIVINDFEIVDKFKNECSSKELLMPNCFYALVYGKQDYGIGKDVISEWGKYIESDVGIYGINGGHFYFEEYNEEFINRIKYIIEKMIEERV